MLTRIKKVTWNLAGRCYLHGLCTWDIKNHWLRLIRRTMLFPELPPGLDGLTVAHLTDLHFSPLMRDRHMEDILDEVNRQNPDFIVLTGDFITTSTKHYARQASRILRMLCPRIASLACLGNHDHGLWHPRFQKEVKGLANYMAYQLRQADILPLINDYCAFDINGSRLYFAGVADYWSTGYDPRKAMEDIPLDSPVIALSHNPDAGPELARHGARHILAGHTHGRVLKPTRFNRFFFPTECSSFIAGQYSLGDERYLHVNCGIGPSARSHHSHRPEITLFTLQSQSTILDGQSQTMVGATS